MPSGSDETAVTVQPVSSLSPTSESAHLFEEACRYLPGGTSRLHIYSKPFPIYARSGRGCRLTDVDGVERIDFLNNMTSLILGHGNPHVSRAVMDQLGRGVAFSEPTEQEVALAKLLVERVPSIESIRFANSGTEAVMLAVKLARAFTGRSRIAKFEGFYHGYYDYVQFSFASTSENWGAADTPRTVPSSGGLADSAGAEVLTLPFNDREAVESLLDQHGSSLAAVLCDPLCNRAGYPRPADGFLDYLREVTRAYGILLIFDEIVSFRLGYCGGQGIYGGDPDLTALGKIIGGGLPIGATGGRADVMALLDPTQHPPAIISGGTFSGNPLTMAAGLAAMEQLTPAVLEQLNAVGEELRSRSNAVFKVAGVRAQLSGAGSLYRIMCTDQPIDNYRASIQTAEAIAWIAELYRQLLDRGVIIYHQGSIALSTPMGTPEVDAFMGALEQSVERMGKPTWLKKSPVS